LLREVGMKYKYNVDVTSYKVTPRPILLCPDFLVCIIQVCDEALDGETTDRTGEGRGEGGCSGA
jgi:hypothetical protein